jgi:hypothetical protein
LLKGDSVYQNLSDDEKYVVPGKTLNTSIHAKEGDILTVAIEEVIPQDMKLAWLGVRVIDIDKDRKEPYYANQLVDMASRHANILQQVREEKPAEGEKAEGKLTLEEGLSGEGVIQLHELGLDEFQTKYSEPFLRAVKIEGELLGTLNGISTKVNWRRFPDRPAKENEKDIKDAGINLEELTIEE